MLSFTKHRRSKQWFVGDVLHFIMAGNITQAAAESLERSGLISIRKMRQGLPKNIPPAAAANVQKIHDEVWEILDRNALTLAIAGVKPTVHWKPFDFMQTDEDDDDETEAEPQTEPKEKK